MAVEQEYLALAVRRRPHAPRIWLGIRLLMAQAASAFTTT